MSMKSLSFLPEIDSVVFRPVQRHSSLDLQKQLSDNCRYYQHYNNRLLLSNIGKSAKLQPLSKPKHPKKKTLKKRDKRLSRYKKAPEDEQEYQSVYQFKEVLLPEGSWSPCARQSPVLCNVKEKDLLVLLGGLGPAPLREVSIYNGGTWQRQQFDNLKREAILQHDACSKQGTIFISGGYYLDGRERYNCTAVVKYDTMLNCITSLKDLISPRQLHCSLIINDQLLIYGGVNIKNSFVEDIVYMNIAKPTPIWHLTFSRVRRAGHRALVIKQASEEIGLVFGGYIGELYNCTNQLTLIKIGKNYVESEEIKTKGIPPEPRFKHVMVMLELNKHVIISGGTNSTGRLFYDCFLLEVHSWNWKKLELRGEKGPMIGHSGEMYQGKFVIFGGYDLSHMASNKMYALTEIY